MKDDGGGTISVERAQFTGAQWELFKVLVLTAERLLSENKPHNEIAYVLRQLVEPQKELAVLGRKSSRIRGRFIGQIQQVISATM